jgi:hypothetical protein
MSKQVTVKSVKQRGTVVTVSMTGLPKAIRTRHTSKESATRFAQAVEGIIGKTKPMNRIPLLLRAFLTGIRV